MELGVKHVTVYAFSIDNFQRSPEEVGALMHLAEAKYAELAQVGKGVRCGVCGHAAAETQHHSVLVDVFCQASNKSRMCWLMCVGNLKQVWAR